MKFTEREENIINSLALSEGKLLISKIFDENELWSLFGKGVIEIVEFNPFIGVWAVKFVSKHNCKAKRIKPFLDKFWQMENEK